MEALGKYSRSVHSARFDSLVRIVLNWLAHQGKQSRTTGKGLMPPDEEFRGHTASACRQRGTRRLSIALLYCTFVATFPYVGQPGSDPRLK